MSREYVRTSSICSAEFGIRGPLVVGRSRSGFVLSYKEMPLCEMFFHINRRARRPLIENVTKTSVDLSLYSDISCRNPQVELHSSTVDMISKFRH